MLEHLEQLSRAFDFLKEDYAKKIIETVNNELEKEIRPHIIDVMWREQAMGGVILRPFSYKDNTSRTEPLPYQVGPDTRGPWGWILENGKPVWIERDRSHDASMSPHNKAAEDGDMLPREALEIYSGSVSFMGIPLRYKDSVWGVYSMELPAQIQFEHNHLDLLQRLAKPIARVIWKSDAQATNEKHTSEAVRRFQQSIKPGDLAHVMIPYRRGFIARPFQPQFTAIAETVAGIMSDKGIRAQHYRARAGRVVISNLMEEIRRSHFGIADVTGLNPNVLVELGMMFMLGKKVLLIQRKDDECEIPFDLAPYSLVRYEERDGQFHTLDPGTQKLLPLQETIDQFIVELNRDSAFAAARKWVQ